LKRALITGVTGQDGSFLAELLLEKGYEVHGIVRKASTYNTPRIDHLISGGPHGDDFHWYWGDLSDSSLVNYVLRRVKPDEVYHLGAQSHVKVSFDLPEYTGNITGIGSVRLLEGIRTCNMDTNFYQASSSEMFGTAQEIPQTEGTRFHPMSPYAAAKLYSYWMTINYREAYGMFACNGILFNHESPRRGETFVTRKISLAAAKMKHGLQHSLLLGNLNAKRDWGYAPEYVEAMWLMLQQDKPCDYVVATGGCHSVREFAEIALCRVGYDVVWEGKGLEEKGIDKKSGRVLVSVDPTYFRPLDVELLVGNPSLAKERLGWQPKTTFEELVAIMVDADLTMVRHKYLG
jgi:GDPmannose 4,6-dehydratase